MQHPSSNLLPASTVSTLSKAVRRSLPYRKVTAGTIDNAYVQFILYCNPGVPLETDTTALSEAFRVPPKSGGKSFSTYTLFELIRQFQNKEIKTWAELALRLGVDPPDKDKGQSTQKIQQYAVRLKRWMHSMHIDAFFDYMLDNHHPYWTELPSETDPVIGESRDGVAAEDDMALRALLPHIRPRRGRKRPDDEDSSVSPSQRPRMEGGGSDHSPGRRGDPGGSSQLLDLWPTHSAVESVLFPSNDQYARMNMSMGNLGTSWAGEDLVPTPLTAHPYSGVTPSAGQALWPEEPEESKSAITPPKPKTNRRHGAKVVSSAWRSGAPGGSGKTRGRPPLNRQISNPSNDPSSPYSIFHARSPVFRQHSPHTITNMPNAIMTVSQSAPAPTSTLVPQANMSRHQQQQPPSGTPQPSQAQGQKFRLTPSRLSLHVPDRTGGEVRLATPPGPQQGPPFMMINGSTMGDNQHASLSMSAHGPNNSMVADFGALNSPYAPFQQQHHFQATMPPVRAQYGSSFMGAQQPQQHPSHEQKPPHQGGPFADQDDRTNIDELESLLTYDMVGADWSDSVGNSIPPCSVEEAVDISQQIIKDAMNTSATEETFLLHAGDLLCATIVDD
ncbi:hypothetical protein VPNG_05144 [Cytospora leucostoma]|uniref:ARS-binding protein 2 n=1 Tax=Cytospora leucostoma TaxID=1230097 RepID=A0A423X4A5_9PEZI|nr:hypothetical protein VPNG_05144 [Cytospora leucostoma]